MVLKVGYAKEVHSHILSILNRLILNSDLVLPSIIDALPPMLMCRRWTAEQLAILVGTRKEDSRAGRIYPLYHFLAFFIRKLRRDVEDDEHLEQFSGAW